MFISSLQHQSLDDWKTSVLRNVKGAAETHGRVFAVAYNIAGNNLPTNVLEKLKEDWMKLVDLEQITKSSSYLHHDGKPVLRIYGIGFKAVPASADINGITSLIRWLTVEAEEKYQVFLIGGVPGYWRDRIKDSRGDIRWKGIYESLDGIHPWHVGRWSHINGFKHYYNNVISRDATHCKNLGIHYMPTMWPGFSWHNVKKTRGVDSPVNSIPRIGGRLMWAQAYQYVADTAIKTIWMAQFDEVDEVRFQLCCFRKFSAIIFAHMPRSFFTRTGYRHIQSSRKPKSSTRGRLVNPGC